MQRQYSLDLNAIMQTTQNNRFIKYLVIGLIWMLLWVISYIGEYSQSFSARVANEFWRTSYLIGLNYLLFEIAIPFLKRSKLLTRLIAGTGFLAALLALVSFGIAAWREVGIAIGFYTSLRPVSETFLGSVEYQTSSALTSIVFFGAGLHIYNYFQLQRMAQQLKIENQAAELAFLKAQTNPHFLFNTLNNIFSLAKDKAPSAADSILRLSGIMRFMLYNSNLPSVSVTQELELLNDYLELEKLRYDEHFRLTFSHNVEDMEQQLTPLLLIPLVENAFKHGVSQSTEDPFVDINLDIARSQLSFTVVNPIGDENSDDVVRENIGLTNLRKQLGLLYKDYDLKLQRLNGRFYAKLKINLLSRV